MNAVNSVTVLYDEHCGFCCECARWLDRQLKWVPLRTLARGSKEAAFRFPSLTTASAELVAVDDSGGVYRGTSAWLLTMWALRDFRGTAHRLASPGFRSAAEALFGATSASRGALSKVLGLKAEACDDGACEWNGA